MFKKQYFGYFDGCNYVLITHHGEVAGMLGHVDHIPVGSGLFLSLFSALGLFPGTGFLFGHLWIVSIRLRTGLTVGFHGDNGW